MRAPRVHPIALASLSGRVITFNNPAAHSTGMITPSDGRKHTLEAIQMVKAYVLIVTNPGTTRAVAEALSHIDGVEAVSEVMGPYDIVVELVTRTLTDIPPILADRIRTLDGIQSTTSLVAFPSDGS